MPAFQSRPQQHRAELHGIAATHQGGMRFLQLVKDVGGSQVDALLRRKRGTEQAANRLLGKADTIESLVVPLQFLLLRLGEPAAPPGNEFRFQLGENPVVLYAGAVDVVLHLDAEETPAPRGIGQQVEAVAGADERGDAGQLPEVLLIGLADVEHRHLHQVFQQRHLAFGILVELVHVEHPHFRQHPFGLSLRGQLQVVGVVACQHVGHQGAAEAGFPSSLLAADKHGSHAVGMQPGHAHPLRGKSQHPGMESPHPVGPGRDAAGKRSQPVLAVPVGQFVHIELEGW